MTQEFDRSITPLPHSSIFAKKRPALYVLPRIDLLCERLAVLVSPNIPFKEQVMI
jgi:hypothetical protein